MLVGLDGSARAPTVFRASIDLARQLDARVVLFRAVDIPPEFPAAAAMHRADALGPKLMFDARDELSSLVDVASAHGVEATFHVIASTEAWRAIIDTADTLRVDAIVVGSHGYDVVDRMLGTNAARVADRAHCLVIVVHAALPSVDPSKSGPYRATR